jgi:ribosomal protein L37AE/L43A
MTCMACKGELRRPAPGVYACPCCLRRGRDGATVTLSLVAKLAAECIDLRRRLAEAERRNVA